MTVAISRQDLIFALAPSLGEEKSAEVVQQALAKLGFDSAVLEPAQVDAVLDLLARDQGLIGVAAKVAKQRSRVFADDPSTSTAGESSSATRRSVWPPDARVYESSGTLRAPSIPPSEPTRFRPKDLVRMLAPSVGDARGEEAVTGTMQRLGFTAPDISQEQALEVLEVLAKEPGSLGVTARFAKARLLLRA